MEQIFPIKQIPVYPNSKIIKTFKVYAKIMSIQIQQKILKNQKRAIAKIFYESFKEKIGKLFKNQKKATTLFSKLIREDQILVALKEGKPVGFVGLHYNKKHFMKFSLTEIARSYGLETIRATLYFLTNLFDNIQHVRR